MSYVAPLKDMLFNIKYLAGIDQIAQLPGFEDAGFDTAQAVLEEAAKFNESVVSPLNWEGDKNPSSWHDGKVTATPGFKEAFEQFVQGGWQGLQHPVDYGGQGLPKTIGASCGEMQNSASISFALCPLLTDGAIEALLTAGSDELKAIYLENLVSGKWTGTMNLTEPQAGSDLAAVRTRAEPQADGSYKVIGTKIFITWGEHDMTANIVHLVLARLPDAPEGVKGISLFVAPKFMVNADGSPGERNDIRCVSIEHKLGIHGSPTCVLAYGDGPGAVGYLVGQPHRGLEYMFTMMNHARLGVGMEGIAISERAYQHALEYARTRVQGRAIGQRSGDRVTIIHHPDVRRMLMTMKAQTEAMRALGYYAAGELDRSKHHPDPQTRAQHQARLDLLTPVVKGWCTEVAVEIASTGVQIHGGMGFIEETGAAQYLRDARISTIYEGTTGIQANDLIGRKVGAEKGATALTLIDEMRGLDAGLAAAGESFAGMHRGYVQAVHALEAGTRWLVDHYRQQPEAAAAVAVPYLKLFGTVAGGWLMARAALIARERLAAPGADREFLEAKLATARFYLEHLLPQAAALSQTVTAGAASTLALDPAAF